MTVVVTDDDMDAWESGDAVLVASDHAVTLAGDGYRVEKFEQFGGGWQRSITAHGRVVATVTDPRGRTVMWSVSQPLQPAYVTQRSRRSASPQPHDTWRSLLYGQLVNPDPRREKAGKVARDLREYFASVALAARSDMWPAYDRDVRYALAEQFLADERSAVESLPMEDVANALVSGVGDGSWRFRRTSPPVSVVTVVRVDARRRAVLALV